MTPEEFKRLSGWDANLKIGEVVIANFTNCYDAYSFKAKITKLNIQTLRVVSIEPNKPYDNNEPNREFIINRFNNWKKWTINNGAFPLKRGMV